MTTTRAELVQAAVDAWLHDDADASDRLQRLQPPERLLALRKLGYSTPAHLEMFGLDPSLAD